MAMKEKRRPMLKGTPWCLLSVVTTALTKAPYVTMRAQANVDYARVCEKIEKARERERGRAYEGDFDVESRDERSVPIVFGRVFFGCGGWVSMGYRMGKRVEDLRSVSRITFTLSAVEQRR